MMSQIDFKNQVPGLQSDLLRRNLFFFDWYKLPFVDKQRKRLEMEEDLNKFILNEKIIDDSNHRYLLEIYRLNRIFLGEVQILLSDCKDVYNIEFFEIFDMFRCFSAKILISTHVYDYMLDILNRDDMVKAQRDSIKKLFFELYQKLKFRPMKIGCTSQFKMVKTDLDVFDLKLNDVQSVLELCGFEHYLEILDENLYVLNFPMNQRDLSILKILKVKGSNDKAFNYIHNLGLFIK